MSQAENRRLFRIERATVNDLEGIRNVLAVTWRDTYSSFLSEEAIAKVTDEWHTPTILSAEIARASTFSGIALDAGEVVGMITAHFRAELLVVTRLYVLPGHQRRGIGQQLLHASYNAFPQASRVRLQVEEQNPVGREFYHKLGFGEVGREVDDVAGTQLRSIVLERHIPTAA
ncbi:MAG: GNAT family N-acetyltransferase [Gemmatimonadales bacterium]|nr:GNAT family N-acetyltransferase [Gemmatimonadales bacterium]